VKFSRRRDLEPEINVTSLIDVVLLLVMFFMVSTSFVRDGHLRLQLPESSATDAHVAASAVMITVAADGSYHVNGQALVNNRPATLRAALERVAGDGANGAMITIRADARSTHQAVVTAMDVAGKVGFAQVNIATVNVQPGS
jgi:biopolymer transport protein ExbD